ncbi:MULTISPECIES: TetR/AcrR family transcriptional regulator [Nocardia]|uniref:TetR/AcrR family transcriptional regulator n=1 Tax=Nocardia TaxID=1817 RepID=UPI00245694F0|nr:MULTISPECIES: TetR/AcrR family transcriptional regulator C-terminal domain-containing protein [Nocardia]
MPANRSRGQTAGLTKEAILRAAIAVADRECLSGLTMRRVAAELGVEAMTLYHHVRNKEALLDGMVDQLFAELPPPREPSSWQETLSAFAYAFLSKLSAHPNLIGLVASRPALTPRNLETVEGLLESICSAGIEPVRAYDMVRALGAFVLGYAATGLPPSPDTPVKTPQAADSGTYPLFALAAGQSDRASRFDFALEALLHGFVAAAPAPATTVRGQL